MDPYPEPEQPDLTLQLPRAVYYQVIHTLRGSLPPPVSDTPEDLAHRDNAAIARVACLLPANGDEANLAATYVGAQAYAMDCLRLARRYSGDPNFILKCTAQAASMMREARATRSLLLRVQAARQKREADGAALGKAEWIEHCAIGLMAQALPDAPRAAVAKPPASQPAEPTAMPATGLDPVVAAAAERYALSHRKRAALIRTLGRLPDKLDFGPLSPQLVAAIVTGNSPVLRSLDTGARQPRA
jgi:hypothetical protein